MIAAKSGELPVAWMCRRLGVSASGYYAWKARKPSLRAQEDQRLRVHIRASHVASEGTYGSPRVHNDLRAEGFEVSRKRIARLMREDRLCGTPKKRFRRTTDSRHSHRVSPNLLERNFEVETPNKVWVSDITYIRTWEGWLYLAVVIDLFARRVVGYAIEDHMRTELATEALEMAIRERRPPPGLVHHSDRGSQYASADHRAVLERIGAVSSMSNVGDCWDNAVAESFFATIKRELLERFPWPTKKHTKARIQRYIDGFYNSRRRHSANGGLSPLAFEAMNMKLRFAA